MVAAIAVEDRTGIFGPDVPSRVSWAFEIIPPRNVVELLYPSAESLDLAAQRVLDGLPLAAARSVAADPTQPLAVPQQLAPPPAEDPEGYLTRLAAFYTGRMVQAEWTATGCRVYVGDSDRLAELAATGPTLRHAAEVILGRGGTDPGPT